METVGFSIRIPGKGLYQVYETIAQYTADNLGLNEAFGMVNSFNCDFCCAICYGAREEMTRSFRENQFELRSPDKYTQDIQQLLSQEHGVNVRGIKMSCICPCICHVGGFNVF